MRQDGRARSDNVGTIRGRVEAAQCVCLPRLLSLLQRVLVFIPHRLAEYVNVAVLLH